MLLHQGGIRRTEGITRGGRSVVLWQLHGVRRRAKAVETAAARKRLLMARYLSWASGTQTRRAGIGTAGERVVHRSFLAAARASANARAGTSCDMPTTSDSNAFHDKDASSEGISIVRATLLVDIGGDSSL